MVWVYTVCPGTSISVFRVAMVREKYLENEIFSSQGILWMVREYYKGLGKSGKGQGIRK